jgi:hypothetical protein
MLAKSTYLGDNIKKKYIIRKQVNAAVHSKLSGSYLGHGTGYTAADFNELP